MPFLLGDLSALMIERLPGKKKSSWTVAGDTAISVVETYYPYFRHSPIGLHEGVPTNEKAVYTIRSRDEKSATIAKHYELVTAATVGGKPRFEATGDGKLIYNLERGVPGSLDFKMQVVVRDANRTEEIPLRVTYRLLSEQDLADAAKEAAEAKKTAEAERKEKARPMTDAEIAAAAADLASGNAQTVAAALKLLGEKKPAQPNQKAASALESVMLHGDNVRSRGEAAKAMKNWATSQNVPGLIKAMEDDWPPVRSGAMEALAAFCPKQATKAVAAQLSNMMTRGAAIKFLKAIGPEAESAVLPYLKDAKDAFLCADVCNLLGAIGTGKSLPALEKAAKDDNWMIKGAPKKALAAIKARGETEKEDFLDLLHRRRRH